MLPQRFALFETLWHEQGVFRDTHSPNRLQYLDLGNCCWHSPLADSQELSPQEGNGHTLSELQPTTMIKWPKRFFQSSPGISADVQLLFLQNWKKTLEPTWWCFLLVSPACQSEHLKMHFSNVCYSVGLKPPGLQNTPTREPRTCSRTTQKKLSN